MLINDLTLRVILYNAQYHTPCLIGYTKKIRNVCRVEPETTLNTYYKQVVFVIVYFVCRICSPGISEHQMHMQPVGIPSNALVNHSMD